MKTTRKGLFETNSSSVHSLTIVSAEDYNKWDENLYLGRDDKFYTLEEIKTILREDHWFKRNYLKESETWTKSDWEENFKYDYRNHEMYEEYAEDYETFEESYTTPSGETVIAFGYYGYDG